MHTHLRRLERVWINAPMYFITICTKNRNTILARNEVAQILAEEWRGARDRHGWAVGRYVIMPDHVHFFCRPECDSKRLSAFVMAWKSWTSRKINKLLRPRSATAATTPLWQREFSDHVLRSRESYSQKWDYVFHNPVRASLASSADEWKYAGEIEPLML
jgi:REP-associated tyrosine transposase